MAHDEISYFLSRAEQELRAADSADHPDAARAHYLLAGYYLDLAHNPAARSPVAALPERRVTGEAAFA